MDVLKGIKYVMAALTRCMSLTFNFSGYSFSLGSVILGSLIISISLALLRFMLRD